MSKYYNYYIGYVDSESNKICPLGPFDSKGKYCSVLVRSRSFASDMWRDFNKCSDEDVSKELAESLNITSISEGYDVRYCKIADLPEGSYIKEGYYPARLVLQYKDTGEYEDLAYYCIPCEVYAALSNNANAGIQPQDPSVIPEDLTIGDYMYFAYEDRHCPEYEAMLLRSMTSVLIDNWFGEDIPSNLVAIVIIG